MAQADIDDPVHLAQEMQAVFHTCEEADRIRSLRQRIGGIGAHCETEQQSAKDVLRRLAQDISGAQDRLRNDTSLERNQQELERLERERLELQAQIASYERDHGAATEKLQELRSRHAQVSELMSRTEAEYERVMPRAKHTLSLFTNITNVKWDYSSPKLAGNIVDPVSGRAKRFEMEPDQCSDFLLANRLWNMVAEVAGFTDASA